MGLPVSMRLKSSTPAMSSTDGIGEASLFRLDCRHGVFSLSCLFVGGTVRQREGNAEVPRRR